MTEELNQGPPRNNSSLAVRAGLKPATSEFQVRRPNHSTILRPQVHIIKPSVQIQTCEQCNKVFGGESEIAASNIPSNTLKILLCISKLNEKRVEKYNKVTVHFTTFLFITICTELYCVCIVIQKLVWKIERTRNAVGTRGDRLSETSTSGKHVFYFLQKERKQLV